MASTLVPTLSGTKSGSVATPMSPWPNPLPPRNLPPAEPETANKPAKRRRKANFERRKAKADRPGADRQIPCNGSRRNGWAGRRCANLQGGLHVYNGSGLSERETLALLKIYNAKCEPRWSEKELTHKANGAAKAAHEKPRGYLLGTPTEDQRSEPDWALPTKPIASGTVPATLATANFDSQRT